MAAEIVSDASFSDFTFYGAFALSGLVSFCPSDGAAMMSLAIASVMELLGRLAALGARRLRVMSHDSRDVIVDRLSDGIAWSACSSRGYLPTES